MKLIEEQVKALKYLDLIDQQHLIDQKQKPKSIEDLIPKDEQNDDTRN